MPLSQDKYRQITNKNHSSQLPLEKLKQLLNGDPKELWFIDTSEDKKSESENDSEVEKEKAMCTKSHFKCNDDRYYADEDVRKECQNESERYEWRQHDSEEYREENEYADDNRYTYETNRGEGKRGREETWTGDYCYHACTCHQQCNKTKSRTVQECDVRGNTDKTWRRGSEEFERRAQPKSKTHGKGCSEYMANRTASDCEEKHCCNERSRCQTERTQNIPVHLLMYSKPFKNVHQAKKNKTAEEQVYGNAKPECCHHTKKILDSYEELPAVDESLERFSETTFKTSSYTKFSGGVDCQSNVAKNEDKMNDPYARSPSWVLCDKSAESPLNDAMPHDMYPERSRKARSRRTRMNRGQYIKWKKALIHPVVEGSRKEMVGVMVWGQRGPEFYSKRTNKKGWMPFRKSRSFPEDQTKSDDIYSTFEPKEVFFAASEPERKPRSKPKTPEEDSKIEEKIATFDKNQEELVNRTKERFFRSLSKEQSNGDCKTKQSEGQKKVQENESTDEKEGDSKKKAQLMPCELLSSRAPKTEEKIDRTGRDILAFNVESKTMAETLNEKAKQFRLSQLSLKEDKLGELEKKYPPKQLDKETKEANLSLWGLKRNEAELKETQNAGGEGDGSDLSLLLRIPPRLRAELNECELHPKKKEVGMKLENDTTESAMEKYSDEMHRERRKKYYGSIQKEKGPDKPKMPCSKEDAGKAQSPESEKLKATPEHEQILFDIFKNLVKEGCAISEKESENLQKILRNMRDEADVNGDDPTTSEVDSKSSEETIRKDDPSARYSSSGKKVKEADKSRSKKTFEDDCQSDGISKKLLKLKTTRDEQSERKKLRKDFKGKKRLQNIERIKLKMIREALPSMAAENEAAHLQQLKKYIHQFIDGVELKISSSPESRRRHKTKTTSSESSEVRVDAQKVIDLVSNPFKRITSDVTIDMAKKLTDALVQETSYKSPKNFPSSSKTRKNSDETEDASLPCPTTSGSDHDDEPEPSYMEGLKKIRNDHLSNITMEVRRLKEMIRFLDRCERLKL